MIDSLEMNVWWRCSLSELIRMLISMMLFDDWMFSMCLDSMLAVNMTFTLCLDTMLLVLSSVFFRIACSQNFSSLYDHHVSVIIFCDKFEHDPFKFEHDSFKSNKTHSSPNMTHSSSNMTYSSPSMTHSSPNMTHSSSNMIHSSSTSVEFNFWLMPRFDARWEYDVHNVPRYDVSRVLECVLQISMLTEFPVPVWSSR